MDLPTIVSNFITHRAISFLQNRGIPLGRGFGAPTVKKSGVIVNQDQALTLTAFYRGVRYIADMLMILPWEILQQIDVRGSTVPIRNRIQWLLNEQANSELNASIWRHTMAWNMIVSGNGYSEIARDPQERVMALGHPIHPSRVRMLRDADTNAIFYRVLNSYEDNKDEACVDLPQNRMFHARGPGDPYMGHSVVRYGSRALSIGIAQDENVSTFFGNGSQPSGVLGYPSSLSKEKRSELSDHMKEQLSGPNAFSVLVLQKGETWEQSKLTNQDSQLLESRQFSVLEVSRLLGLPPHILMDYGRATWSNLEHASTETVRSGLMPWAKWLATEANIKLVAPQNRRRMSTKMNFNALLQADTATRNQAYALGRQWGWWSANDIRRKNDEAPVDGLDSYLVPLNMREVVGGSPIDPPTSPDEIMPETAPAAAQFAQQLKLMDLEEQGTLGATAALPAPEGHLEQSSAGQHALVPLYHHLTTLAWNSIINRQKNQFEQCRNREDFEDWAQDWVCNKHVPYCFRLLKTQIGESLRLSGYEKEVDWHCILNRYEKSVFEYIDFDGLIGQCMDVGHWVAMVMQEVCEILGENDGI